MDVEQQKMIEKPRRSAAIIVNPVSGRARARRRARKLLYRLAREGISVALHETTSAGSGRVYASQVAPHVDFLVSVGGDGTLNDCMNGVLDAGALTPILVVSTGTANVVSSELGLPKTIPELIDVAIQGKTRRVDVCALKGFDADGQASPVRHFSMCAGAGFDGAVVEGVQRIRTAAGITRLTYALPILGALLRYKSPPMRVTLDGQCVAGDSVFTLVANMPHYGGAFQVCRSALPDDGLLDVCCLTRRGPVALLRFALGMLRNKLESVAGVKFYKARTVEIESKGRVPVQVDGDCCGTLPLRIEVCPAAVNFLVN